MSDTEFLDELKKETEDPFAHLNKTETETPAESSPANKVEEEKPKEGEDTGDVPNTPEKEVPFHEHPRWKARQVEIEELRQFKEEATAKLSALEQKTATQENIEIPKWFTTLYGENAEAWGAWQEADQIQKESWKRELVEDQVRQRQEAQAEEQKWDQWINVEVEKLKAEGLTFDRNELIKAVLDYGPTDENNNYDFKKAYNILQATKTVPQDKTVETKKRIANMSSSGKSGESAPKDYVSSAEIRKVSWNQI